MFYILFYGIPFISVAMHIHNSRVFMANSKKNAAGYGIIRKKVVKRNGKTVQENLGHATSAFTLDTYGHVTEKMKKDSADRMQAFIKSVS